MAQHTFAPFSVDIDLAPFDAMRANFPKDIQFAIAYAMTQSAKDARDALVVSLREHFTIRRPSGGKSVPAGIRYYMTNKREGHVVHVGSIDSYMRAQVLGGEKHAGTKSRNVAVPVGARKNKQSITGPSRWAGAIDNPGQGGRGYTGDIFTGTVQTKKGPMLGTWRRMYKFNDTKRGHWREWKVGRKWGGQEVRGGVKLLYLMEPSVKIPKRWPMAEIVTRIVAGRWALNARRGIRKAIRVRKGWRLDGTSRE